MAEVAVVMTGEEAKLWRAQQKILAQTKELEGSYKKVGSAGKKAGDDGEKAAKNQAAAQQRLVSSINQTVASWVSVTAAVNVARQVIAHHQQETESATRSFDTLNDARRRLTQVSVDASDRQRLETIADQASAEYGVEREVTRRVLFSARSEGFEDFFREIISSARVVAPESAAQAAGQIPALFPGAGLTPRQSVNAALVAATQSRLTFEQLTANLPGAAEGAGAAGAAPAETMALQSVLASRFKSGETAADRIRVLGAKIALDSELGGKGIVGAVKELQAAGEERRKDFLGESNELNAAFRVVGEELATIEELTRLVDEAIQTAETPRSALARARAAAVDTSTEVGRQTQASIAAEQARIRREIVNEGVYQTGSALRQAALDQVMADIKMAGGDAPAQAVAEWVGWAVKSVGGSPEAVAGAAGLAAETFSGEEVGALGKRITAIQRQRERETAGALESSARQLNQAAANLNAAAQEQSKQAGSFSHSQRAQAAVPP
jgi:hypothetical protein